MIRTNPVFNQDGTVKEIRMWVENNDHLPIEVAVTSRDADLSTNAGGRLLDVPGVEAALQLKYRAAAQAFADAKTIKDAEEAAYLGKRQALGLNMTDSKL